MLDEAPPWLCGPSKMTQEKLDVTPWPRIVLDMDRRRKNWTKKRMLFDALVEANHSAILLYSLCATLLVVILVLFAYAVHNRRNRLNWYEKNLLEIANSPPQYVRCKALPRFDTDEEQNIERIAHRLSRKQSRIRHVQHKSVELPLPSGDLSNIFTVPRIQKTFKSMYSNPEQSQIDRCLYQTTMDSESGYDDEASSSCGSIKICLFYDINLSLLTVVLKQANELVAKRQDGYPNPYFKVTLDIPENTQPKTQQQSKIYKNTASPIIDEEFFFQVPNASLGQCRLEILVFDYDQFSVDECIGYCWLTLGRVTVSTIQETPTVFWAEVLPFDDDTGTGFGEVLISLAYLSKAQRLTINVFKARNLPAEHGDSFSSNAIRLTLVINEKRMKRKKTSSKKNTRNPQFNESLTFSIPKSSLCDIILEIEAIHEHGTFGMGSKVLGRMELPLHKCKDLWRTIIREEKSQARWYSLEEP